MKRQDGYIALAYFIYAVLLRFQVFHQSVYDWDESVYLVVSDSILRGHLPYIEIWDHKPPLIYYVFALFQIVFGQSVMAIRWGGCVCITISAMGLYFIGREILRRRDCGLLAGIFYLTYGVQNSGLASNSEIIFAPLVIFSVYHFCRHLARPSSSRLLLASLLLGLSLQIKYVTIFEGLGIIGYFYVIRRDPGCDSRTGVVNLLLITLGTALPTLIAASVYACAGYFADFYHANFTANLARAQPPPISARELIWFSGEVMGSYSLIITCVLFTPLIYYLNRLNRIAPDEMRRSHFFLGIWTISALIAAMSLRGLFPHYFLEILPPLSLSAAYNLVITLSGLKSQGHGRIKYALTLGAILLGGGMIPLAYRSMNASYQTWRNFSTLYAADQSRRVAAYVNDRTTAADYLFVPNWEPVLYHLTHTQVPIKFILRSHLFDPFWLKISGADTAAEMKSAMAKQPKFVIVKHSIPVALEPHMHAYEIVLRIDDIVIYRQQTRE